MSEKKKAGRPTDLGEPKKFRMRLTKSEVEMIKQIREQRLKDKELDDQAKYAMLLQ